MATVLRSELSKKNKYYIDKHRYYELKHFCLQYPEWKKLHSQIDGFERSNDAIMPKNNKPSDPTYKCVETRNLYLNNINLIDQAATDSDPGLVTYIVKAITEGLSYAYLKNVLQIPCSRDTYYDRYRQYSYKYE